MTDNDRIREAIDSVEPAEGAMERMRAHIEEKAAAASAAQKKTSGKITILFKVTAVAACLALAVTAVAVPLIKGGKTPVAFPDVNSRYNDGVIGENKYVGVVDGMGGHGLLDTAEKALAPDAARTYEEVDGGSPIVIDDDYAVVPIENSIFAGTLTAGEWKDADAIEDWVKTLTGSEQWTSFALERGLDTAHFVRVTVTDGGKPCCNAKVELLDGAKTVFTARTDVTGRAYLFYSITGESAGQLQVKVGDSVQSVSGNTDVAFDAAAANVPVTALDLMLMVDTTGSMGDELEYLKAELADMVQRIAKADDALSIRVSVNFYRDEGDAYIVKYYDFRENIEDCLALIKDEVADGGGDTPEAVHTALDNAINGHAWRDDAVKLCFLVLDAPPHSEQDVLGVNESLRASVLKAAALGVRIIPVASSGVDSETEFLLRSYALMTGGTYVFLTDDSGVGGNHKDPELTEDVTVEYLNDCMVRIACEYCGIYAGEKVPYTPPQTQVQQ